MVASKQNPIRIFYSYSHKDEEFRRQLETHLALLRRQGMIDEWHDRKVTAGKEWKNQIDEHLETANIILLLISSDFVSSDYCYDIEMKKALERHDAGEAYVIPILLRPIDWAKAPFAKLQMLPIDGKPVKNRSNRDEVWREITWGIRKVVEELFINP